MNFMKNSRKVIMVLVDLILIGVSFLNADILIYNFYSPMTALLNFVSFSSLALLSYIVVFYLMDLYNKVWLYAGLEEISKIFFANLVSIFVVIPISMIIGDPYPVNVYIVAGVLMFLFSGSFRFSFRLISWYSRIGMLRKPYKDGMKRVLVIGAGAAGSILVKDMKFNRSINYLPVGFIDDDYTKIGNYISNIKVVGDRYSVPFFVKTLRVDVILIAIATIDGENKRAILDICKNTACEIMILPNLMSIFKEKVSLENLRKINIEDLLGRESVFLDKSSILKYITDKVVLVSGGAGSIGYQLCRNILKFNPKELVVIDSYHQDGLLIQYIQC